MAKISGKFMYVGKFESKKYPGSFYYQMVDMKTGEKMSLGYKGAIDVVETEQYNADIEVKIRQYGSGHSIEFLGVGSIKKV